VRAVRLAVFGLGEAGSLFAREAVEAGAQVHGYDPAPVPTPEGVVRHGTPTAAVSDVDVVLALTAAVDAEGALRQALGAIPATAVYADCATGSSGLKRRLSDLAAEHATAFVDVALMSPVPGKGIATPALASGPGAARFVELMVPVGMDVVDDGPEAGRAAARKLLRSVVMKGFAALLIESMEAAHAAGLADETWENLVGQFTDADEALMRRLVDGTAPHSLRRLHEMEASAALLVELGIDPVMTRGTVESLRRIDAGESSLPELP
jgi:3-hydroxyisobutyrate dehydrogenase-like beta-hydroxyacid dehydrogenase